MTFEEEWAKNETASPFYQLAKFWYEKGVAEISRLQAENERLSLEISNIKEVQFPNRIEKITNILKAKLRAAESLAADQEAIERRVALGMCGVCAGCYLKEFCGGGKCQEK